MAIVKERSFFEPLQRRFKLSTTGRVVERRDALDTFDLRFHRAGVSLSAYTQLGRLITELCPAQDGAAVTTTYSIDTQTLPNFARDLPRGVVCNQLHEIAGERRLQRLVRLKEEVERFTIVNDLDKTVVRLAFVQASAMSPTQGAPSIPLPALLVLSPLRGYQTEFEEVIQFLETEHALQQSAHSVIELGLAAIGWEERVYSTRPEVSMCDSTPIEAVALEILRSLFEVLRANEDGVRHDLDTDYLKDFRAVLWRAQSLLHAFQDQLKGMGIETLEEELAWLGEVTRPVRNLDIQLLAARKEMEREKRLWSSIVKTLEQRRESERQQLSENLNSERYMRFSLLADRVMEKLAEANSPSTSTLLSIGEFAPGVLERAYGGLIDRGRSLKAQTSAQEVHRLISASKRLRYLIEFFQPLKDSQPSDIALQATSDLHDELGSVNDSFVRIELLEEILQDQQDRGKGDSPIAKSIDHLLGQSPREKKQASARAWQAFLKFDLPQNRPYFVAVFQPRGPVEMPPRQMQVGVEVQ
ncbi:MAG: CHAD domain-containing protein [Deltaproteobacteria bacterium]|nr:CHAD domain-containing protein [Deltaproteobacteria bacterium]